MLLADIWCQCLTVPERALSQQLLQPATRVLLWMSMLDALSMLCASFQSVCTGVQAGSDMQSFTLHSCVWVHLLSDVALMPMPEMHTPGAEDCAHGRACRR